MAIQILAALLEIGFLCIWLKEFVNRRKLNRAIIAGVILCAAVVRYYSNEMESATFSVLLGIVCSLTVSVILFTERYEILFFYTIISHTLCVSAECLTSHFMGHLLGGSVAALAEIILLLALLWPVKRLSAFKRNADTKLYYARKQCIMFDLVSLVVCGFSVCLYILGDTLEMNIGMNIGFALVEAVLIISAIAIVYLYKMFGAAMAKARELENINVRLEKVAEHYQSIEELHEKYDTFMHDMKHQMRAIAVLAEDGDCEEISSMIAQMRINVGNIEQGIICSNRVLNALLLERKGYADDNGVTIETEVVEPLILDNIEDMDLVSLIGNLLDNAIEAQIHAKNPNGIIFSVRMAREGMHVVIHLENDYDEKYNRPKVTVKSREQIWDKHGIGLKSVRNIVRKYGGIIESGKYDGRYVVDVILPIQGENAHCIMAENKVKFL